jgi:hypothetical protein
MRMVNWQPHGSALHVSEPNGTRRLSYRLFLNSTWGEIIIHLPLLYQSRGALALCSGIDILPFMISSVIPLLIAGILVEWIRYYRPWMVFGPWVVVIGVCCMTNPRLLKYEMIIGRQVIVGTGFGVAFQNTSTSERLGTYLVTFLIWFL